MLKDRVYVVTGGATGIGAGIARVLRSHGARVATFQPGSALDGAIPCDVRKPAEVNSAIERVVRDYGRLDGLVNNAALTGLGAAAAFLEASAQHIDDVLAVNVKGPIYCSQAFARHCVRIGQPGAIVHIASVGAFAAQENAAIYCASKAALAMLAKSMALELAQYGIRVNAVAPGDIYTATSANIADELAQSGASGRFIRRTPLGRRGTPGEVGEAAAFLLSERASFITGETIVVDGGYLAY